MERNFPFFFAKVENGMEWKEARFSQPLVGGGGKKDPWFFLYFKNSSKKDALIQIWPQKMSRAIRSKVMSKLNLKI